MNQANNLQLLLSYAVNKFLPQQELKILSIGCGNGNELHNLYNDTPHLNYQQLLGVDEENKYVDYSLEREFTEDPFKFEQIDGRTFLKDTKGRFDLIIISNVLHFYEEPAIMEFLYQSINCLTEIGIVCIIMANTNHRDFVRQVLSTSKYYGDKRAKKLFTTDFFDNLNNRFEIIEHQDGYESSSWAILRAKLVKDEFEVD
jgi:SAM-dependent methyltransferase